MADVYSSSHSGEEVDATVSSSPVIIRWSDFQNISAASVPRNKLYIISDGVNINTLWRSNGSTLVKVVDTTIIISGGTDPQILGVNNTETRCTVALTSLKLKSIALSLSENTDTEYIFGVVFKSDAAAISFDNAIGAYWGGDATSGGVFTPVANKRYNLVVWWDGEKWQGVSKESTV